MNKLLQVYARMTEEEREAAQSLFDKGYTEIEAFEIVLSFHLGRITRLKELCYEYRNENPLKFESTIASEKEWIRHYREYQKQCEEQKPPLDSIRKSTIIDMLEDGIDIIEDCSTNDGLITHAEQVIKDLSEIIEELKEVDNETK